MRIIAGTLRGRRIAAPPGRTVRPTSDRLRETLFNVLARSVAGARVLDAFAGTGALGIEAWSRGASSVAFVERDARVAKVLDENLRLVGAAAGVGVVSPCAIIRGDFLTVPVPGPPFDLVLLDPPYDIAPLEDAVARGVALASADGVVVLEHSRRRPSPEVSGAFGRYRVLTAGDSALSFYCRTPD